MSNAIAETIIAQLGGHGRLSAMTGAKDFAGYSPAVSEYGRECGGVAFKFGVRGQKDPHIVRTLLTADDLYSVEFGRTSGLNYTTISTHDGIYADGLKGLFERATGLYLTL